MGELKARTAGATGEAAESLAATAREAASRAYAPCSVVAVGAVPVHFPGPGGAIITRSIDELLPQPCLRCSLPPPPGRDAT